MNRSAEYLMLNQLRGLLIVVCANNDMFVFQGGGTARKGEGVFGYSHNAERGTDRRRCYRDASRALTISTTCNLLFRFNFAYSDMRL